VVVRWRGSASPVSRCAISLLLAPGVLPPIHDITPPIQQQLVLELKRGIQLPELFQWYLARLSRRLARPMDQQLQDVARKPIAQHGRRCQAHPTMANRWQGPWCAMQQTPIALEHPDVEDIVMLTPCVTHCAARRPWRRWQRRPVSLVAVARCQCGEGRRGQ
jgi:hypothetical protein